MAKFYTASGSFPIAVRGSKCNLIPPTCFTFTSTAANTVVKAVRKDPAHDQEEALKDIYRRLRPGDPPTVANARALLKRLFFDPKKYDLGRVGRYKINQKLGIDVDLTERILTDKDFIAA